MTPDMEECTGRRDGWDEDETGPLTTGRAGSHADVVHTSQGMMRDARECAVRKQMPGKAAPPKLALHPASSPFCAWAGRGQQGPGRGPLPQAQGGPWGGPWEPLGHPLGPPGDATRHISGPLGVFEGFFGTTSRSQGSAVKLE